MKIHGHRGCRGLMPENTIPAFLYAIGLGVHAIELDVVITADKKVLVSHEPWLSHKICLSPSGEKMDEINEMDFNLYRMNTSEIQKADCGSLVHPDFPLQQKMVCYKPSLQELIVAVEAYLEQHSLPVMSYTIEVKSESQWYGRFQPYPDEMVYVLLQELSNYSLMDRVLIQSFDNEILKSVKKSGFAYPLGLLIENSSDIKKDVDKLGFIPEYYNPEFGLLNDNMLRFADENGIKIIPWTVNEIQDMKRILSMGVNGMITDFPNLALEVLNAK